MFILNLIKNIILLIIRKLRGHRPISEEAQTILFFVVLNIVTVLLIFLWTLF